MHFLKIWSDDWKLPEGHTALVYINEIKNALQAEDIKANKLLILISNMNRAQGLGLHNWYQSICEYCSKHIYLDSGLLIFLACLLIHVLLFS